MSETMVERVARDTVKSLRAERDYWRELAEKGLEPRLKSMRLEDGEFNMEVVGPAVELIAIALVGNFKANKTQNYYEMTLYDRDEPYQRYVVTVQKAGALSPHDKAALAEAKVAELQARIDAALSEGEQG